MGQLATRGDSAGHTQSFTYDLSGNLVTRTNAAQRTTNFSYDRLNRLTQVASADGHTTTYERDQGGRITRVVDSITGEKHYQYDLVDRVTAEISNYGTITYQYDAADQVVQRTVNDSDVTTFGYDPTGRLISVTHDSLTTLFTYNPAGELTAKQLPGGLSEQFDYDASGRLAAITHLGTDGNTLMRIDYSYDEAGQLVRKVQSIGQGLSGTPLTATYDKDNRLLTLNGLPVRYDTNGNLIERQTTKGRELFTYNAENRLVRFERYASGDTTPSTAVIYAYDEQGRRASKIVNGLTTIFRWEDAQLIAEYDAAGNLLKRYTYDLGLTPVQMADANGVYDVHTDHLGTPLYLTDAAGRMVWQASYEPYGRAVAEEAPDGNGSKLQFQFRFPGQYEDSESGLHYNMLRFYDPDTGQYLTRDPVGITASINLYGYVDQSPIDYIDPFGLYKEHTSGSRPSTRNDHEEGQARRQRDRGGEKGDANRDPPRKKPPGHKGPWPPLDFPLILPTDPCLIMPSLCLPDKFRLPRPDDLRACPGGAGTNG